MTAHQRALRILAKYGPLEPAVFGLLMWPKLADSENSVAFSTSVGNFLAGMVREGLARKVGRQYRARRGFGEG